MKALFVHDHIFPKNNTDYYESYGFEKEFFDRYLNIFGELSIIGREKDHIFVNKNRFNKVDSNIDFLTFKNLKELKNKENRKKIDDQIHRSDYVIIRLPSILGTYAVQSAKRQKKPYIIEVVGCPWDAIVNKGLKYVLPALAITLLTKRAVSGSMHTIYVTEEFLERRYPTSGKYIACSNVTLNSVNEQDIRNRLEKIDMMSRDKKVIFGTCATIDVIYKGQQDVIAALAKLVKEGHDIEYQLVGGGDSSYLKLIAEKYGVLDRVKFIGTLKHEDVFKWLDNVDVYIHPSKQEGLSRAIIEAMSKGCPIIGADAGGIHEQIDAKYIFKKGNVSQICEKYKEMTREVMKEQAIKNHNESKKYLKSILYKRRENFFKEFINAN
ncbi:glycosyltransferase family 4 protein [Ornithinibacillus halotolerans]|uniref:Glycosyl transferase family 1 domain-containing protein n=1 Tax=Ornithinibacillus halotolerans TaxID=1274357 RepID=A0A916RT41_9BACI|nr:glycosyltransferase [Ornithinibacillus halotolerans]GGA65131.1 hypothetical protein GCM10008025_06190 [Ornithinibacillus halotolerans]